MFAGITEKSKKIIRYYLFEKHLANVLDKLAQVLVATQAVVSIAVEVAPTLTALVVVVAIVAQVGSKPDCLD